MKKGTILTAFLAAGIIAAGISGCAADKPGETAAATVSGAAGTESAEPSVTETEPAAAKTEAQTSSGSETGKDTAAAGEKEVYTKQPEPPAADGDKILFVGNSHTFTNNLPGMFYEMALAGGHEVEVMDLTEGYYTLARYADPEDELGSILTEALQTEEWDFVVLQENTNAAISINAKNDMYPYARELDRLIQDAGGQTAFLMTWAPEEGAGAFSREMVQTMLSAGYQNIARELDALLIPGGLLFEEALKQDEELDFWGEDGQHPSEEGTYLAVCAAYALFFQETPVGNPYLSGLDDETAAELQEIAGTYMLNSRTAAEEDGV